MLLCPFATQTEPGSMSSPRTLSIVGASEETTAHVRLLMRMAGRQLQHRWQLREGEEADLVIIEPGDDIATRTLPARCQAAGIPFAILADEGSVVVHGMVLRRPLRMDQLVAVLNAAGQMREDARVVSSIDADFYNAELGDLVPQGSTSPDTHWDQPQHEQELPPPAPPPASDSGLDALDLLIHGDPLIEPEPPTPLVDEDTTLDARQGGDTARSTLRREDRSYDANLIGITPLDVAPISRTPLVRASKPAKERAATAHLAELLKSGVILSPTRINGEGLPELVLDPKLRRYYSRAQLHELLPYAEAPAEHLRTGSIVGSELQRVRDSQIPRSFDELQWLLALATSRGRLDSRLDPGGSYSIRNALVAATELRSHGRIAALMATPMPLHEIARASGARMEEVFDIVNAYHAIGRIEYIPRQRLQGIPPTPPTQGGEATRSRLARLFGKK